MEKEIKVKMLVEQKLDNKVEGFEYAEIALADSIFKNLKKIAIFAKECLDEDNEKDEDQDHVLLKEIYITNKDKSFDETIQFIKDEKDYLFKLIGEQKLDLFEKILVGNIQMNNQIVDKQIKKSLNLLAVRKLDKDKFGMDDVCIQLSELNKYDKLTIVRRKHREIYSEDDNKKIYEYKLYRANEIGVSLKEIISKNIDKIYKYVQNQQFEKIEQLIAENL
ncbi:hypothetical protein [Francisella philomiragia]|uniref:hypothetical protein n=1 Tax=Francisella philomiragia TaxID=28110 RepID=UPI001B8B1302|nr:hypothetical protein [Francisella philomiragia]QUE32399.1 hypothetical protein IMS64_09670 [Francisella philomiragia]